MGKDGTHWNGFYAKLFVGLSILAAGGVGTVLVALTSGANDADHKDFKAIHIEHEKLLHDCDKMIAVQTAIYEGIKEDTDKLNATYQEIKEDTDEIKMLLRQPNP